MYCLLCCLYSLSVAADNRSFTYLQDSQFLSDEQVNTLCKDTNGVLWIGTANGLNCYDGYEVQSFFHNSTSLHSLPDNHISHISRAPGQLLLVSSYRGYCFIDPVKRCVVYGRLAELCDRMRLVGEISQLYSDEQYLWFCFQGSSKILRYDSSHGTVDDFSIDPRYGYVVDKVEGHMAFLTSKGQVFCLEGGHMVLRVDFSMAQPSNGQPRLYIDSKGNYYYFRSGGKGFIRYISGQKRFDVLLDDLVVNDLLMDQEKALWVATDHSGVIILDTLGHKRGYQTTMETTHSIPHNNILCLYQDEHQVMWLGGYKRGISYYVNKQVDYVNNFLSTLPNAIDCIPDVTAVLPTEKGCWLGTNEHGLLFYDCLSQKVVKRFDTHSSPAISSNVVVSFCQDADGSIWVGQYWGGLAHLIDGQVIEYRHQAGKENGLSSDNVWDLYQDEHKVLWIATLGGGLQSYNPRTKRFKTFRMSEHDLLPSDVLYAITPGPDDILYIATSNGVCAFHRRTGQFDYIGDTHFESHLMNGSDVIEVYYDSRGLLWILTRTQMHVYDVLHHRFVEVPFLANQMHTKFAGINEDAQGRICVSCADEIWLVTVSTQEDSTQEDTETQQGYGFDLHTFGRSNFIQNRAFNQRAIALDHQGQFWIGGSNGVTRISPAAMYDYTEPVNIHLKSLYLKGQKVAVDSTYNGRVILSKPVAELSKLTLDYNQNMFSLSVYTDHILNASNQQFAYTLSEVQEQWMPLKKGVNEMHFMNVKPGTYLLNVCLYDTTGYYLSNQITMQIVVLPPLWLTWWAYGLYLLLGIVLTALTIILIRYHLRQNYQILQLSYEAKREKELTKLRLQFFTDISHEIRTPLSLILGPLQRCIQSEDLGSIKKQMRVMQQHGSLLMRLVNQILDYRKIDISGVKVHVAPHDLTSQLTEWVDRFQYLINQQQAHLCLEGPQQLICGYDDDLLEKVLTNLLSNALKYGGDGVTIHIVFQHMNDADDTEKSFLSISVKDNGPGISVTDQDHVFERFYRNEAADDEQHKWVQNGTGIGLFLVKHYVEAMGGQILLKDNIEEGHGCVFSFTIPTTVDAVVMEREAHCYSSQVVDEKPSLVHEVIKPAHNELVLIVDDHADFRAYLLDTMKAYYHLECAVDGVEAWEMIPTLMPDIIILDKMMPRMDGLKLCQLIKEDVRTAHIPVIMLTACTDDENRAEGLAHGADDYISKPFEWEVLNLRIEYLLDKNRLQQEKFLYRAYLEPNRLNLSKADETFLTTALHFVQDHVQDADLTVEGLSQELGMSRAHLYKKLTFITGKSPVEFIRLVRLKTAAHLLKQGDKNVSEVAYAVGFKTPKYFSKQFKEVFGLSPSAYGKED